MIISANLKKYNKKNNKKNGVVLVIDKKIPEEELDDFKFLFGLFLNENNIVYKVLSKYEILLRVNENLKIEQKILSKFYKYQIYLTFIDYKE